MHGRVHTIVELERVTWDDGDRLYERRYPGWELRFNNDRLCFGFGRRRPDQERRAVERTGDRLWLAVPLFASVLSIDVARPGAQVPPSKAFVMPMLSELESAVGFAVEAIDDLKSLLDRVENVDPSQHPVIA